MPFQIAALPEGRFADLFSLTDDALRARGARRYVADRAAGFPCRVSLEGAQPGEPLILVSDMHQPAESPYQASGLAYLHVHCAGPGRSACRVDRA